MSYVGPLVDGILDVALVYFIFRALALLDEIRDELASIRRGLAVAYGRIDEAGR